MKFFYKYTVLSIILFFTCYSLKGIPIKFNSDKWKNGVQNIKINLNDIRFKMSEDVLNYVMGKTKEEIVILLGEPDDEYMDSSTDIKYDYFDYYLGDGNLPNFGEFSLIIKFDKNKVIEAFIQKH